jgi:tripartite-type tricarboxylate transporter receptor subunit TctC
VAWNVAAPTALLVADNGPFKTMQEFMARATASPHQVTVGGVETFSASDLALAELVASSGIKVNYVPITGGAGPLLTSLRGGHVDAIMLSTAHAVRTEGVKALAVAGDERFKTLPDVPTFKELGYDVTVAFAWGVGMPSGTPEPIVTKFGNAVLEVMKQPGIEESLLKEGLLAVLIGPDRAVAYVDDQRANYERLVPLVRNLSQ